MQQSSKHDEPGKNTKVSEAIEKCEVISKFLFVCIGCKIYR